MSSTRERSGRRGRRDRFARVRRGPLVIVGAVAIALAGLAGCGNGPSAAGASSATAPAADAPQRNTLGEAQRWCGDEAWLLPAAGLYVSAYGTAHRPIGPERIDADLASGGPLWAGYRRLSGGKPPSAGMDVRELREFFLTLAEAEADGTDPMKYARHTVATCDS